MPGVGPRFCACAVILPAQGEVAEAVERCFTEATALARSVAARGWELRAATSLARLWASQGRAKDAKTLLAPVYEGFDEGRGTPDLEDARSVLGSCREPQDLPRGRCC